MSNMEEKMEQNRQTGGRAQATWKQLLERHARIMDGSKNLGVMTISSMDRWETWRQVPGTKDVWQLEAGGLLNDRH